MLGAAAATHAQSSKYIDGYFRKDGTYVQGHYRNTPSFQYPNVKDYTPRWHEDKFDRSGQYIPGHYSFPGGSSNPYKPYYSAYNKPYETYKAYKPYNPYSYKPYNPYKKRGW